MNIPTHQRTRIRTELRIHHDDGRVTSKTVFADATFCRAANTRDVWADAAGNIRNLGSFEIKVPEVYEVAWKESNCKCPYRTMSAVEWVAYCERSYPHTVTVHRGKFMNRQSFAGRVVSDIAIHKSGKHTVLD